ncbi:MAG TPA: hypothetical protein VF894_14905 [Anaeromyxobacter sp.]
MGKVLGIFRDAGIATELNVGNGFQAALAGPGGDLAVPFVTMRSTCTTGAGLGARQV